MNPHKQVLRFDGEPNKTVGVDRPPEVDLSELAGAIADEMEKDGVAVTGHDDERARLVATLRRVLACVPVFVATRLVDSVAKLELGPTDVVLVSPVRGVTMTPELASGIQMALRATLGRAGLRNEAMIVSCEVLNVRKVSLATLESIREQIRQLVLNVEAANIAT